MNSNYIATVMHLIRDKSGQNDLQKDIRKRVYDITRKNCSHIPEFMKEGVIDVVLLNNGEEIEHFGNLLICYIEGESGKHIDIDDDTAFLLREYNKREETMNTLNTILLNQNKSVVVTELPDMKDIFEEADRIVKEEKDRKEQKWTVEVAAIQEFLAS